MYNTILGIVLFLFLASSVLAETSPFETTTDSRQRHSSENYETYKSKGSEAPLGGYNEKLGDPAPKGTEKPGYVAPKADSNNGSLLPLSK